MHREWGRKCVVGRHVLVVVVVFEDSKASKQRILVSTQNKHHRALVLISLLLLLSLLLFIIIIIIIRYSSYWYRRRIYYFDALFSLFLFPAKPIERNRDIKPLFSSFFPSSATLTSLNISTICSNSGRVFISACHEYWMVCARTWWQLCGMVGRMPLWTTPTAAWRGVYPE